MTYALLRHGQTAWNARALLQGSSDIPLDETGRDQARRVASALHGMDWSTVVSSPLSRARETAEIIAGLLGVPLGAAYDELSERDYGALEGTSAEDALERWPDREYPGAEPLASVVRRGHAALDRIAADHGDVDLVIVAHGTLIRFTLEDLSGRVLEPIHNGSLATLRSSAAGWTVLSVNGAPLEAASGTHRDAVNP